MVILNFLEALLEVKEIRVFFSVFSEAVKCVV